ncbi:MAG: hypothetical protein V2A71_07605, partial [Candidatus Eisenbacteria bacterium]
MEQEGENLEGGPQSRTDQAPEEITEQLTDGGRREAEAHGAAPRPVHPRPLLAIAVVLVCFVLLQVATVAFS